MTRRTLSLPVAALLAATAAAAPAQSVVRVCAGGDVTLGVNGDTARSARRHGSSPVWPAPAALIAPLIPLFADADIALVNVEGAIGAGPASKCSARSKHCYAVRMPVAAAPALRSLAPEGTVVANVANNHAHDAGDEGFSATLRLLDYADVRVTGADSEPTLVTTARGDTIALLGFAASPPMDVRDLALVRRLVARAAARTTRVVVTMHLGAEGPLAQRTRDADETFVGEERGDPVAFARAAVESGATLVVGHGPHVVRGIRWSGSALVLYSLGNLLSAGPFAMHAPNDRGVVACADLAPNGRVTRAVLRPTRQTTAGLVRPDLSARAVVLADSLGRLDFRDSATRVRVEAEILPPH